MIRSKTRVERMLDAIDMEIAECDTRQLHSLKQYALRLSTTNCSWAHYQLRTFLIEYIGVELDARRKRGNRE